MSNLKIVGIVPKDRGGKNTDPELNGIFVPLRIALKGYHHVRSENEQKDSIVALLEEYPYIVLLGGPGSGKSTATRYLAWSHAVANQTDASIADIPQLSGNPLPLRIELRRLTEDRRQHPDYDFLSYAAEVLLGREGIEISPQMFKELLERRALLLLFDGLDEVDLLVERKIAGQFVAAILDVLGCSWFSVSRLWIDLDDPDFVRFFIASQGGREEVMDGWVLRELSVPEKVAADLHGLKDRGQGG